jgi:hypothetical protein
MYNTERFRFLYVSYKKNTINASIIFFHPLEFMYAYSNQNLRWDNCVNIK